MIPYILHTSILLAGSFIFYWALLRNETFYSVNRYFLLTTIVLSLLIPAISVPYTYSIHEPEVIVVPEDQSVTDTELEILTPIKLPVEESIATNATSSMKVEEASEVTWYASMSRWNWQKWVWNIYLIGVGIFVINFLTQLIILFMKKRNLQRIEDGDFTIFELEDDNAPFSFLEWIFINPALYDLDTFNQILEHEKIHIKQVHYVDKFLVELMVIVFWFNPFVWLYRKTVSNNLEFLTDAAMLNKGVEKEVYQMSLLKVSVPEHALDLTTNYNESFLSERIRMMNAKRSSAKSSWKYLMILPILTLSMSALNAVIPVIEVAKTEVEANNKVSKSEPNKKKAKVRNNTASKTGNESKTNNKTYSKSEAVSNSKNNTKAETWGDKEWEKAQEAEKHLEKSGLDKDTEMDVLLTLADMEHSAKGTKPTWQDYANKGIKEAKKWESKGNEIAKASKATKLTKSQESTDWKPQKLENDGNKSQKYKEKSNKNNGLDYANLKPGSYKGKAKGDEACFQLNNSDRGKNNNWNIHECFNINEISNFSIGKNVAFHVKRDAGTINFDGDLLTERYGYGVFDFEENASFVQFLKSEGFSNVTDEELFHLFLNKTDKNWVKTYKNYGFKKSTKAIVELGIHGVNVDRLKEYKRVFDRVGERNPSYKDMIAMAIHGVDESLVEALYEIDNNVTVKNAVIAKIHGVSPSYITAVKSSGFSNVNVDQVIAMKIHGVSTSDISGYKSNGYKVASPEELVNFAIHGVNPNMVNGFIEVGFDNLSSKQLTNFAIHGVSSEYVKNVQKAGLRSVTPQDMVNFAIHGVSSKNIKAFVDLGYRDITVKQVVNAAVHGVSPYDAKKIIDMGYKQVTMGDLVNFNIHGVNSNYIKGLRDAGLTTLSAQEVVNCKIHGVYGQYVQDLRDLGIQGMSYKKIVNAKIHGVSATFVKKARSKGYKPKYLQDYVDLKIQGL